MVYASRILQLLALLWSCSAASEELYQIELSWEAVPGATGYQVELVRQTSKDKQKYKLKTTKFSEKVAPGIYSFRLRTFDDRDVPGDWSAQQKLVVKLRAPKLISPKEGFRFFPKNDDEQEIIFSWEQLQGAAKYTFEIVDTTSGKLIGSETTQESQSKQRLERNKKYTWRVQAISEEEIQGAFSEGRPLHILGGKLKRPNFHPLQTEIVDRLSWKPVQEAERYLYKIYRKSKSGKWKSITKAKQTEKTFISFLPPKGRSQYKLLVSAKASGFEKSDAGVFEFVAKGGYKSQTEIQRARIKESLTKPSDYFFTANYYISSVEYLTQDYEQAGGEEILISGIAGNLRAGLGYEGKGKLGFITSLDVGGIQTSLGITNFFGFDLDATWSGSIGTGKLTGVTGLYSKQLPVAVGNSGSGVTSIETARVSGVQLGLIHQQAFSLSWGLRSKVKAQLPLSLNDLEYEELQMSPGYEAGVSLSHSYSRALRLYLGVSYRYELVEYTARPFSQIGSGLANEGDTSRLESQALFLNLGLDWNF